MFLLRHAFEGYVQNDCFVTMKMFVRNLRRTEDPINGLRAQFLEKVRMRIYYIVSSPLESVVRITPSRLAAFENTPQGVLCARNLCLAMLGSHWTLESTAQAYFEAA